CTGESFLCIWLQMRSVLTFRISESMYHGSNRGYTFYFRGLMPHLLITDDESATRELIAEVAADVGYTVSQAGDIRQARIQIERQKPDVMLMDMQLPDGDGMELWKKLELSGCHVVFM